ncbi:hypothetical protein PG994_009864 [Apiospora phragmitis]|uniref:Uncharacterized protein n=1 Tax=Apiospora phragmitis TaxID=2905665 RepID=A0ABR1TN94_9PEZI
MADIENFAGDAASAGDSESDSHSAQESSAPDPLNNFIDQLTPKPDEDAHGRRRDEEYENPPPSLG